MREGLVPYARGVNPRSHLHGALRIWLLAAAIVAVACAGAIYLERHQRGTFDTLHEAEQMTREGDRLAVLVGREIEGSITAEERTELASLRQRAKDRKRASEVKSATSK